MARQAPIDALTTVIENEDKSLIKNEIDTENAKIGPLRTIDEDT